MCADPDDLPFTSSVAGDRGLYLDLADLIAARLGTRVEPVFSRTDAGLRALRPTLLAGRCDVFFGLPWTPSGVAGRSIRLARPFLDIGSAVVAPKTFVLRGLQDLLDRFKLDRFKLVSVGGLALRGQAAAGVAATAAPAEAPTPAPGAAPAPSTANQHRINPYHGDPAALAEGRTLFNVHCSHCHSPNAASPDPVRDLRRLDHRYGERVNDVFYETVTKGRPTKGMPIWGPVLDEQTIWKIKTFLESVQATPGG